jgi:hypothetical protein
MFTVHLTLKSRNEKTGPIPVSTTTASTCSPACPFMNEGCYAKGGPLAIHWRKVTQGLAGMPWADFVDQIADLPEGKLWRHNQAGDLPGHGDSIDIVALASLVSANNGKRGFTYTHKPTTPQNVEAIRDANANGFTINLSGNNLEHADQLADLDAGPVVVVLPADQTENTVTPAGRKVVVCPASIRDGVSCATCKLCAISNRAAIIGFPAHGAAKRKASNIAAARHA